MSSPVFLNHPNAAPGAPLSVAVRVGDYVYLSGQVPVDEQGVLVARDIDTQTRQVMVNIGKALALAGCSFDDVFKTTAWLEDARDFSGFNRAYATFFTKGYPARSTTEARLMGNFLVEIEVVAYRPLAA